MKPYLSLIFLFSQYNVMNADFMFRENVIALVKYNQDIQMSSPVFPLECRELLDKFADAASNFTKCSIKHARPVRMCRKCIEHYVTFRDEYKELIAANVNGTSCKSLYISHDRLDDVLEYHDNILAVWDKGNCNECFEWDSKENPKLLDKTVHFYELFNDTMDCIVNTLNPYANNTKEVCETCMPKYIKLDEFYKTLSKDGIGVDTVCMDVVDSMNATRYIWSKILDCCNLRKTPEIAFLCCTAITGMLVILFYVSVRFYGPIRDLPNVLKQSRFKQTILRSSERNIN